MSLPFGDPCVKCGAASAATDPRDRDCVCAPCDVCGDPTLGSCAVCGRSLGCRVHRVSIERHVETYCLATRERHIEIAALPYESLKIEREKLRASTPRPWPVPIPPWGPP